MKQYRIIALLLTLLLALAACGEKPAGETSSASSSQNTVQEEVPSPVQVPFTLAVYADYSLNPTLAANRANLTLAPLLYEPLFAVDGHFQAQPVLCQSWTASEDKLVWTFTLRDRITFSDGTPFTAREAAEALELARSSRGRYAQRLADVALISGEDQNLTITLRRPNGDLPALLDIPIALGDGDRPLGTGPYVLTETGDEFSLTARSGWWQTDKTLPVQTIPLHRVSKSDDLIYAFDAGEVSLVDVDLMATNAMGYGGNYQTWDYATTDFLYLGFNTGPGGGPKYHHLCHLRQPRHAGPPARPSGQPPVQPERRRGGPRLHPGGAGDTDGGAQAGGQGAGSNREQRKCEQGLLRPAHRLPAGGGRTEGGAAAAVL